MLFALLVASLCESVSIPQEFAKDIVSKRFWDWVKHHVIPGIPARKIVSTKNEDEEGLKWKKDFKIGPVDGKVDIDIPFPWEKNADDKVAKIQDIISKVRDFALKVKEYKKGQDLIIKRKIINALKTLEFNLIYKAYKASQKK